VKAQKLRNSDWGARKESDPYVVIRELRLPPGYTSYGKGDWQSVYSAVQDRLRGNSSVASEVPGEVPLQGRTPVVQDSVHPEWNFELKARRYRSEGLQVLVFLVLDSDARGRAEPLGWAKLVPGMASSRSHVLPLNRVSRPWEAGQGELHVHVTQVKAEVVVPNVVGMTPGRARREMAVAGLDPRNAPRNTRRTPRGEVHGQSVEAGTRQKCGTPVWICFDVGDPFEVPEVRGLTERQARRTLRNLHGLSLVFETRAAEPDAYDTWFKVVEQCVPPGGSIYQDQPLTLRIAVPPEGTEIEVPDVKGKPTSEAVDALRERHLHVARWEREEVPREKAGRVLDQDPAPGTKITYGSGEGVTIKFGFYADGLSYHLAKKITLGEAFECDLDRPDIGQFRRVSVPGAGYLVCRKASHWHFTTGCRFHDPHGRALGAGHDRLNCARRVTEGDWVLRFAIEYHMAPGVLKFQTDFVPEFDHAEPNDDFGTAFDVALPSRLTIGLCPQGDADFYRIETEEPGYLSVTTGSFGGGENAKGRIAVGLQIFDAERKLVWRGSLRQVRWLPAGRYYLRFAAGASEFDTRPYDIHLAFEPDTDRTEPNDSVETATVIHVPTTREVRYATDDVDHYRLVAEEPGWVVISHPRKLGPQTYVWPLGPDGKPVARHELPCALSVDPECVIRLSTVEQYRPGDSYEPVDLRIQFVPRTEDELEPNDDPATAPLVEVNRTHEALLLPVRDVECYRFRLTEAGPVEAVLPRGYAGTFLFAQLLDADGKPIDEKGDYVPRKWELPPGEYVVRIWQYSGRWVTSLRPYAFRIQAPNEPAPAPEKGRYEPPREPTPEANRGLDLARQAFAHYRRNEFAEAAALYEQAAVLLPSCAALWNDFGSSCFRLGSLTDAEAHFRRAVEIDPGYALAMRNLGVVARQMGDLAGYVEWTGKARAADPSAENLSFHGHALLLVGRAESDRERRRDLLVRAAEAFRQSLQKKKDVAVEKRLRWAEKRLELLVPK
jgi:hypothetical protein